MNKKISLLLAAVLSSVMLFSGCAKGSTTDQKSDGTKEQGTFKVGMECGYAPFNWTQMDNSNGAVKIQDSSDYANGYDVQIAQKIADSMGKKLVVVKTKWDGLIPALSSGKIDTIIAGMSPTAERKQAIDFTDNYYTSNLVMVVKKGGKYDGAASIQDFKGAKITAQLNTFHYTVIEQIQGVNKLTAMSDFPAMRVALQTGKIDGYVSERPEGVSAEAANNNFKMVEFKTGFQTNPEDTAVAVGLAKGSALTAQINKALSSISEDQRKEIMDKAIKNQPAAQ